MKSMKSMKNFNITYYNAAYESIRGHYTEDLVGALSSAIGYADASNQMYDYMELIIQIIVEE